MPRGQTLALAYLVAVLAVTALLAPVPNLLLALIPLGGLAYHSYRPLEAGSRLALSLASLLIVPLAMEPVLGMWAFLLVAPALPWLHHGLKGNAASLGFVPRPWPEGAARGPGLGGIGGARPRRRPTTTTLALGLALLLVAVFSGLAGNSTLLAASLLLGGYLGGLVAYVLFSMPPVPVEVARQQLRIIAGASKVVPVVLNRRGRLPVRLLLETSYPWVHLSADDLYLGHRPLHLDMSLTPPLSGPSLVELRVSAIDPWGLVEARHTIQPVELQVIPRARYAAWLAQRYLEQAGAGAGAGVATASTTRPARGGQHGLEYLGSRSYQPGDRLRDVDWRHTFKLNELITKERVETPEQSVILAVNLSVRDAEEADLLAHDLITTALTLAREAIPTALIAYDHTRVVETASPPGDPRHVLRRALRLPQNIVRLPLAEKFLQSPDFPRLRRVLGQLELVPSEPARRLHSLLDLEYQAWQAAVKDHPATQALLVVTRRSTPPALVSVVSLRNHDAEALDISLEKLHRLGFGTVALTPLLGRAGLSQGAG